MTLEQCQAKLETWQANLEIAENNGFEQDVERARRKLSKYSLAWYNLKEK